LQPANALMLLELLSTMYIAKQSMAPILLPTICELIGKFWNFPRLQNFVEHILIAKALSNIF
jgi:hypothetical protein